MICICIYNGVMNKDFKSAPLLKQHGLKFTQPRQKVLSVLSRLKRPATAKEIYGAIGIENCDLATIHRILASCERSGIVRSTSFNDKSRWYELSAGHEHHHHLFCTRCKRIDDLPFCKLGDFQSAALKIKNFKIASHSLEFFGLCKSCLKNGKKPSK